MLQLLPGFQRQHLSTQKRDFSRQFQLIGLILLTAFGYPLACLLHCTIPPAAVAALLDDDAVPFICHLPQTDETTTLPIPVRPDMVTILLMTLVLPTVTGRLYFRPGRSVSRDAEQPPAPPPRRPRSSV